MEKTKKCGCIWDYDNIYSIIPAVEIKHECKKHKSARIKYLRELIAKRKKGILY